MPNSVQNLENALDTGRLGLSRFGRLRDPAPYRAPIPTSTRIFAEVPP
jgi:hypothetical protein